MQAAEFARTGASVDRLLPAGEERRCASESFASVSEPEFSGPTNAFCITLFNERRAAFEATIRSLLLSVMYFHGQMGRQRGFSMMCIIADGRDQIDPEIIVLLRSAGLLTDAVELMDGADLHASLHSCRALLRKFGVVAGIEDTEPLERLRAIVCVKHSNRGKLQSHSLFFNSLCAQVRPVYCYQIDSGTMLAPDAVLKLVQTLERDGDIAAAAPRIMPAAPAMNDGFLATWQYLDFALQKCIVWPFEAATGHLSVIPGQACVFRWRALQDPEASGRRSDPGSGPLSAYLRGVEATSPLDRLMYLAEDRVIGNQIVLAAGRTWRLEYAPEASAVTDGCLTLGELLRQRRRWRNSALACRIWLLAQSGRVILREDRSPSYKLGFSRAMGAQLLLVLRDFFAPAQLVALLAVLYTVLTGVITPTGNLITRGLYVATVVDVGLGLISPRRVAKRFVSILMISRRTWAAITTGLLIVTVMNALPLAAGILGLAALTMGIPAAILTLSAGRLGVLLRAKYFPVIELAMVTLLSLYSFWNLHDVSWGTKGLRSCGMDPHADKSLLRWRNFLFSVWLVSNCLLMAGAVTWTGLLYESLNPVFEVACICDIVTVLLALGYLISRRRHCSG